MPQRLGARPVAGILVETHNQLGAFRQRVALLYPDGYIVRFKEGSRGYTYSEAFEKGIDALRARAREMGFLAPTISYGWESLPRDRCYRCLQDPCRCPQFDPRRRRLVPQTSPYSRAGR
jgi:hypothetical protein